MKDFVMYHDNCADGFGAAFAAWLKLGDSAEYVPMNYGDLDTPSALAEAFDCSIEERTVYILDFSLKRPAMEWLMAHAKCVVWLDHHKTAFEMWTGGDECEFVGHASNNVHVVLDNSKSGAVLAWEYFHQGESVPLMIQHIDDRDRWQFRLEGTREFSAALFARRPWTFKQWRDVLRETHIPFGGSTGAMKRMYSEGDAILRAHNQDVASAVKQARSCSLVVKTENGGCTIERGLAANCPPSLSSDVGHALAQQSGAYGLCWSLNKDGVVQCSLRSTGDYDVSAIAKAFGGGGHRNAAGFRTKLEQLKYILGV